MLKEEKGITLVALVLIIVVLLILAGVSIAVVVENSDGISPKLNSNLNDDAVSDVTTNLEEAETKVRLVFELLEANYQTDFAKGIVTDRSERFTATNIISSLTKYGISGNTQSSLGNINLTEGITVNYNDAYTFIVRVNDYGIVSVIEK